MHNARILSAVLAHWASPAIRQMVAAKIDRMPAMAMVTQWARESGLAPSAGWTIGQDLLPIVNGLSTATIGGLLLPFVSQIPDSAIPNLAYSIVKHGEEHQGLQLMGGNVRIDMEDIRELKRLLDLNLPQTETEETEIKT